MVQELVIQIDIHEPKGIVRYFENLNKTTDKYEIRVEYESLPVGDYIINGVKGVERKTWSDLRHALTSDERNVFNQCDNIKKNLGKENTYLLVEGDIDKDQYSKFPSRALKSVVLAIGEFYATPIISKNLSDTKHWLKTILFRSAPDRKSSRTIRLQKPNANIHDQQLYIICGFPGIGQKTGMKILERNSIYEFVDKLKNKPESLSSYLPDNKIPLWSEICNAKWKDRS